MPRISLTKKFIDQLEIPEDIQVFHDTKVTGLQLRVSPKGSKTFYLYFRTKSGKQKRPKLGVYGILTVERARDLARAMLGELSKGSARKGYAWHLYTEQSAKNAILKQFQTCFLST